MTTITPTLYSLSNACALVVRVLVLVICSQSLDVYAFAFLPHYNYNYNSISQAPSPFPSCPLTISSRRRIHSNNKVSSTIPMINNLFSGITGQPPKQLLQPSLQSTLLENTNIDPTNPNVDVDLQCIYKGSRDGFSAVNFHNLCDGRGSGLVVILTKSGKLFGGFNPLGWDSTDDYGNTNSAFLWFAQGQSITKANVLRGGNAAIFDYATGGPQFGSGDLVIGPPKAAVMGGFAGPNMEDTSINAGDLRKAISGFGGAYESVSGWPRGNHNVAEVEIYVNANIQPRGTGSSGGFRLWPF